MARDTAGYQTLNITDSSAVTVPPGTPAAITSYAGTSASVSLRGFLIEGGAGKTDVPGDFTSIEPLR